MSAPPILCLAAAIFLGCDSEKIYHFEVGIDPDYRTDTSDDWVVISDKNGTARAWEHFESDMLLRLPGVSRGDTIAVTFLSVVGNSARAETWLHVNASRGIDFGYPIPLSGASEIRGTIGGTLVDPDLNASRDAQLSNRFGSSRTTPIANGVRFEPLNVTADVNDFLVFASSRDGVPYHKFLDDVAPHEFSYTLADLDPYEHTISLHLYDAPQRILIVVTGQSDPRVAYWRYGYCANIYQNQFAAVQKTYTLGFSGRLEWYFTFISATYDDHSITYETFGQAPTEDIIVSGDPSEVVLNDRTFIGFSFAAMSPVGIRESTWSNPAVGVPVVWTIYGDGRAFANPQLPEALLSQFPMLKPGALVHQQTRFAAGDLAYDAHLDARFRSGPVESYTMTWTTVW